jgi:hypothetical protein
LLVTPIDWKQLQANAYPCKRSNAGHYSLVTPIDWKPVTKKMGAIFPPGHHSLVTPIDWKPPR